MTTPGGSDRNVNVTLNANVDPFQRAMGQATTTVNTLTAATVKLAKGIDELIKKTGKKLELFGAGGLASIVAATEAASRLDHQFQAVRATAALTGQSVNALKESAASLSRSLPIANGQAAQLIGQVQDLGVRGTANITRFTEVAIRLGAATNTPPGQLFTGLLQLTRTMNSSIQDIDRYSSTLVSLSKTNGVAGQQILDFSNAIQSVAQRAGYTQTQVLGLSTAFSKVGADSGAGANAFIKITNDISEAMRTGSKQLDSYASIVGVSRQKFAAMAKDDPSKAFIAVIDAIGASGPKEIAILQSLGLEGAKSQRAIAALTSGQANLSKTLDESGSAFRKNQALNQASNASYKDLSNSLEKFRTAMAQVTESIGAPFLGVATKVVDAITGIVNVFNNMPGSVKTIIGILGAVASTMSLLGGGAILAVLALTKFGAVWRLVSGAIGTNVFRGIRDGFRGMPKEIDSNTAAMNRLYLATFKVTDKMKGDGTIGNRGGGPLGLIKSAIKFPFKKGAAEVVEAYDTLKPGSTFNYNNRSDDHVSPYTMNGGRIAARDAFHKKRDALLNSEDEGKRRIAEAVFGDPAAKAKATNDKLAMETERLIKIKTAQQTAMKEAISGLKKMDSFEFDAMVREEHNKTARKRDRIGDDGDVTDKMRGRFLNNAGVNAGLAAGENVKKEFAALEGDEALNPFKRLASKIKTLSAEMVGDIGGGVTKVMSVVETAFAQGVARIVQLAASAKQALVEVGGGMPGSATAKLSSVISTMGGAATQAATNIASTVTATAAASSAAAAAGPVVSAGTAVASGDLVQGVVANANGSMTAGLVAAGSAGAIGAGATDGSQELFDALSNLPGGDNNNGGGGGPPQEKERKDPNEKSNEKIGALKESAIGGLSGAADKVKDKFSALAEHTEGVRKTMGNVIGKIGAMAGPAVAIGTTLFAVGDALHTFADRGHQAALAMGRVGDEFSNSIGQKFQLKSVFDSKKPDAPKDINPYSDDEYKTSGSKEFYNRHKQDIDRFAAVKGGGGRKAYAATLLDRLEASNGGPLNADGQQEYRELLMRGLGRQQGTIIAKQNLSRPRNARDNIADIEGLTAAAYKGSDRATWTGTSGKGAQAAYIALGQGAYMSNGINDKQSYLAATLLAAAKQNPNGTNSGNFQAVSTSIAQEYKKQTGKGISLTATDIQGVLDKFQKGDDQAKQFGKTLEEVLNSVGFNGNNAAEALARLGTQLSTVADAASEDKDSPSYKLAHSFLGSRMGHGENSIDFNFDMDKPGYKLGAMALNNMAGQQANGKPGALDDIGTYTRQLAHWMEVRASNPGNGGLLDLANSQIAAAQGGIAQQRQFSMNAPSQVSAYARDATALATGPNAVDNTDDIQKNVQAAEGAYQQGLETLKGYVLAVKQYNRNRIYEEKDHNLQLSHMYRDRNQQLKSAAHDQAEQIRSSKYETALAYGAAGGFVNSEYTQSATSALTGAGRQNNLLRRSKKALDTLAGDGLSKDTIRLFNLDDPKNVQQAERFVKDIASNPNLVKQFNASIKGRLKISEGISTDTNSTKFQEMKRGFDYAGKQATRAFNQSLGDFQTAYKTAADREKDALENLAQDTSMSVTQIMEAAKKSGVANIQKYASEITKAAGDVQKAITAMTDAGVAAADLTVPGASSGAIGAATGGAGGAGGNAARHDSDYAGVSTGASAASGGKVVTTSSHAYDLGARETRVADNHNRLTGVGGRMASNLNTNANAPDKLYGNVSNQAIAKEMAKAYGWDTGAEWNALQRLWGQESGWKTTAGNPSGGAYGIPQAYAAKGKGNPMASAGSDWLTNPRTQIAWGLSYIAGPRYGDPIAAVRHKDATNSEFGSTKQYAQKGGWYAKGGLFNSGPQVIGVGEAGPEMVLPLNSSGSTFLASVLAMTLQRTGMGAGSSKADRTAGRSMGTTYNGTVNHHVDASTNFTGDVHVVSSDPNEMARKLADKKRMGALTRPASSGAR